MSIQINGVSANPFSGLEAGNASQASKQSAFGDVLAEFMKVAMESPYERIKDSILKSHGMTQAQYNAMPAGAAKDSLTKEIEDAIRTAATGAQQDPGRKAGISL